MVMTPPDPWACVRWARDQTAGPGDPPVTPSEKFVLVTLASYAGYDHEVDEWSCHPGQKLLADGTAMGERTVRRHLKSLESRGWISRAKRYRSDGTRSSDQYVLAAKSAGSDAQPLAANPAGSDPGLPATPDTTTGQNVQGLPATLGRAEVPDELPEEPPPPARAVEPSVDNRGGWGEALAELVHREELVQPGGSIRNPARWRSSVRERLALEHVDRASVILARHPSITGSQLADALTGNPGLLRHIPAEPCPDGCHNGLVEDVHGNYDRCPTCTVAAVSA